MNTAYLILGANLADREKNIRQAISHLEKHNTVITKRSSVYETEPWGKKDQNNFLNIVIEIKTRHSAQKLMDTILQIEKDMGRIQKEKWAERIIDIDILFFNYEITDEENLKIPHPYLQQRKFVLVPLAEIAGDFVHPILKKSIKELLSCTSDDLKVVQTHPI